MTDLPFVSATQISLWTECKRKWGFKYLDRVPDPPKPGALLGTEVQDTQLDPYLLSGRGFDFSRPSGEIANALVPLLPKPAAPGMRLRRKFKMTSPSGKWAYQGEFDVWGDDSSIVPGLAGGRPLLGDIKTTKDLKYAKSKEDLLTDVQCQLYAADIMFNEEGCDELDAVWWYARTQRPHKVQRTHVLLRSAHVAAQFERTEAICSDLITIKLARPKVDELQPNPRMCGAYGGCPYRSICNLSPASFASAWNDEEKENMGSTNDFLAGLRKQVAPETPPPADPLPSWATAAVDPRAASATQKTWTMSGTPAMPSTATAPPAINPPETELPPAPPTGGVIEAPKSAVAAASGPAPAVETVKKRGRPRKAQPATVTNENTPTIELSSEVESVIGGMSLDDIGFPRSEFATFLRAWAARMEAP